MFYKDPLAAAYMAREFGVTYLDKETSKDGAEYKVNYALMMEGDDLSRPLSRYDIHPDSLPIFEPKKGDKICRIDSHTGKGVWDEVEQRVEPQDEDYPSPSVTGSYIEVDSGECWPIEAVTNIFQRNGRPFFWPEIEQ